jgi:hypothetical protein
MELFHNPLPSSQQTPDLLALLFAPPSLLPLAGGGSYYSDKRKNGKTFQGKADFFRA